MKTYVWLTFAFMGWGYYEMSGGADFVPEERVAAVVEAGAEAPEIVARAATTTLMSLSTSNVVPAVQTVTDITPTIAVEVASPVMAVFTPQLDIREVAGSRVNMREGPSTSFDVVTTLDGGTKLEVLSVNENGWANVNILDIGINGWMAERLLTDTDI